jgi:hypothetical protein
MKEDIRTSSVGLGEEDRIIPVTEDRLISTTTGKEITVTWITVIIGIVGEA